MPGNVPRVSAAAALVFALVPALAACDGQPLATTEIRYELRVEMTIDGRPVSASTVHGLRVSENMTFGFGAPALLVRAEGQAIVHDMGDGRGWLIVPLEGAHQGNVDSMFISSCIGSRGDRTVREYVAAVESFSGVCEVEEPWRPVLIKARDKADKSSLEAVEPEDFGEAFGPGVQLERVVMEPTSRPISTGILDELPWLEKRTTISFDYIVARGKNGDEEMTNGDFATELRQ